jgi:SAM-dependent methyltransferase
VRNGVPILLAPESRAEIERTRGIAENVQLRQRMQRSGLLALVDFVRPPHPFTFMRWRVSRAQRDAFSRLAAANASGDDAVYLDIGSGILGGANAAGLSEAVRSRIVPMEIEPISGIGVVGDAHRLPWKDGSIDGVLIQGVLEHVRSPSAIVAEILRVLKPGAPVYVEIPFLQHFHLDPIDHWRWTVDGIEAQFAGFEVVDKGVCAGPAATLTDVLTEFPATLFGPPALYWGVKLVVGWLVSPLQLLDALWARSKRAHGLAAALFYLGRRPRA